MASRFYLTNYTYNSNEKILVNAFQKEKLEIGASD